MTKQIQTEIDEAIEKYTIKAVQECGVVVDKEELIKALNYDRQQYEKGYADAKAALLDADEWCIDCKEYDQEKHCCPRWNRVIRETVEEMKQNTGHWLKDPNRIGYGRYICSECRSPFEVEEVMGKPKWKFCPNCGARLGD